MRKRIEQLESKDWVVNLTVFLLFFLLIALFYIRLPLCGSLPGDFDTWANLAMFLDLMAYLDAWPNGHENGTFLYPFQDAWRAYGWDFFSGIIWIGFFKFGLNAIWSYWLYLSTLLTLNSFSLFLLSGYFVKNKLIRLVLSLVFSVHVITYSNIDNPNVLSYIFALLALRHLMLFSDTQTWQNLLTFSLLAGLQLYASPTVFFMLFFASAAVLLATAGKNTLSLAPKLFVAIIFISIVSYPYIKSYLVEPLEINALSLVEVAPLTLSRFLSIQWRDFFSIHPAHLYSSEANFDQNLSNLKHLFPGIFIGTIALYGFTKKKAGALLVLAMVMIVVGHGRYIFITEQLYFNNPLIYLFGSIDIFNLFRVAARVNIFLLLCMLLACMIALQHITLQLKHGRSISTILLAVIAIEASAWEMKTYSSTTDLFQIQAMNKTVAEAKDKFSIVLNLPTGLLGEKDVREYKYMINRFYQQVNTLNGSAAYMPESRIAMKQLLEKGNANEESFCNFLDLNKVDGVLLFKDWILDETDTAQINMAEACACLIRYKKTGNIILYEVKPSN